VRASKLGLLPSLILRVCTPIDRKLRLRSSRAPLSPVVPGACPRDEGVDRHPPEHRHPPHRHAPRSIKAVHIESLFSAAKGYIGVRHVRSMFFIDFESIAEASNAMVRFQGYRHALAEARPARPAAAAALSRSRRVEPIAKLLPC